MWTISRPALPEYGGGKVATEMGRGGVTPKTRQPASTICPLTKQAEALRISRSSVYYLPRSLAAADVRAAVFDRNKTHAFLERGTKTRTRRQADLIRLVLLSAGLTGM